MVNILTSLLLRISVYLKALEGRAVELEEELRMLKEQVCVYVCICTCV